MATDTGESTAAVTGPVVTKLVTLGNYNGQPIQASLYSDGTIGLPNGDVLKGAHLVYPPNAPGIANVKLSDGNQLGFVNNSLQVFDTAGKTLQTVWSYAGDTPTGAPPSGSKETIVPITGSTKSAEAAKAPGGVFTAKNLASMGLPTGGGGGGGVSYTTTAAAPAAPAKKYNKAELEANYGYAASFFGSDKSLTNLINEAVKNQWTPDEFANRLRGTTWYKTHTAAQRNWTQVSTSDPAEANQQRSQMRNQILATARKDGVVLSNDRLVSMAEDALKFGWNAGQINQALASEYKYTATGQPSSVADSVKAEAAQYLVPLSDQAIQKWSQQLIAGSADQGSLDSYLKEQAKSMFPGLATAIDSGVTVAHYVDPYKQLAAQTLEIPPDQVDFMDPKYGKALFQVDPKTGARTSMSLADWQTELRTNPIYNYDKTSQARQTASDMTTQLAKTFGAVG